MSYTVSRDAAGRTPFYILEIVLDQCTLEYTQSPCAATDAGDGARCMHSWRTCQDRDNYTAGTQTLRFLSSHVRPQQIPLIRAAWPLLYPVLGKVDQVEQEVSIFGGFSRQEKRRFSLGDISGNSGHDIVPTLQPTKAGLVNTTRAGSFWRRMVAVHPNYATRRAKLYQGFVADGVTTGHLLTAWEGKLSGLKFDRDGGVSVEAVDLLGDFEKKLPAKIAKSNTVQTSLSRTATTVTVRDASEYTDPATSPNSLVVARVKTIVGRYELVKITARDTGANTLTVTRGQYGTFAEPWHGDEMLGEGKGAAVQEVLHYSTADGRQGLDPMDVVEDLLLRSGVAAADIDTTQLAEARVWIGPWKVKRTISKPTQVKQLLHELLELYQGAAYIDHARKVRVYVSRPTDPTDAVATLTETDILDRGAEYDQGEDRRLTHASLAYGYTDDDDGSGAGLAIYITTDSFRAENFGADEEQRFERALKGGRWVQDWDVLQATAACARWAKRSELGRERLTFTVDIREELSLQAGTLVDVLCRYIQDEFGAPRRVRCLVISRKRVTLGRYRVTLEDTGLGTEAGTEDQRDFAIIGPASMVSYDSDTVGNRTDYGYLSDALDTLGAAAVPGKRLP